MVTIAISGIIARNEWEGESNVTPESLRKSLEKANGEDVLITINSPGGSVFEGLEMYSLIKNYRGKTETRVISLAASMASIIALAGQVRSAESTASYMIHNATGIALGDYREMQRVSEFLKNVTGHLANIYTERTSIDNARILQLMADESWFFGTDLTEFGFQIVRSNTDSVQEATAKFEAHARYNEYIHSLKSEEVIDDLERVAASLEGPKSKAQEEPVNESEQKIEQNNSADAGENNMEETLMDLNELKSKHPDIYAQAVAVGVQQGIEDERDRVEAHLTLGESANAMDLAVKNIREGKSTKSESVTAAYLSAGMDAKDKADIAADNTGEIETADDEAVNKADTDAWTAQLKAGMGLQGVANG
jgi:ATP-dependent Clp protease protease subunit